MLSDVIIINQKFLKADGFRAQTSGDGDGRTGIYGID